MPQPQRSHASLTALLVEPDATIAPIYNLVRSATTSIDITMYELVDTEAQQLLAAQAAKGVRVRVILDRNLEQAANTPAYTFLAANGVHVVWAPRQYAATHQKTITLDATTSLIMTLNLTSRYYSTSRDFALLTTSPQDIAAIQATFNADFTAAPITPPTGDDLVWSPTNADPALLQLIASATSTIALENEEMSDPGIVAALAAAAKRGVSVDITMSANPAFATELQTLADAGAHIRTYAQTAPLYIHAKVVLVDVGLPTQRGFLGSENFSTASLTRNRELGITITDPGTLSTLNTTLAADFAGATPFQGAASMQAVTGPVRLPS